MKYSAFLFAVVFVGVCLVGLPGASGAVGPIGTPIGEAIDLVGDPVLEGIAFDDVDHRLYVLSDVDNDVDGDGKNKAGTTIQIYAWNGSPPALTMVGSVVVPEASGSGLVLTGGRGLAFVREGGRNILYTLSSRRDGSDDVQGRSNFRSHLWRIDLTDPAHVTAEVVSLDRSAFDLRGAEVFDVACDRHGRIFISFDGSKQAANLNEQRSRGILRLAESSKGESSGESSDGKVFSAVKGNRQVVAKMLPTSAKTWSHHCLGLTVVDVDGHDYLAGTIEKLTSNDRQEIYAAEPEAGRGLFKFDAPPLTGSLNTERRLAYGDGVLWVGERKEGLDQVRRVVIKDDPFEPLVGFKRPRRVEVTIISRVVCPEGQDPGAISHNWSNPLATAVLPSQGRYFEGRVVRTESPSGEGATKGTPQTLSYMPMHDPSSRSEISVVRYVPSAKKREFFKTVFEEDFWTREYRHFVYPHLTSNDLGILKNTDFRLGYLKKGDSAIPDSLPRFHWTKQERIFDDFIERVKAYTVAKHGVEADLSNVYWAARNISEYIRDNYNYPAPPASDGGLGDSRGNVFDFVHNHVANGPAVYKMIMTDPRFEIGIHDRRSGCMAAGGVFLAVMRYLGYPARWIGTSRHQVPRTVGLQSTDIFDDRNGDGMFDGDDSMKNIVHGHYTNEVYLGPGYGWQRFDATPKKPDDRDGNGLDYDDFGVLHSRDSQYELMKRKITPGQNPLALAGSLGVGYHPYLFRYTKEHTDQCAQTSVYHEATGVYTSACYGGQCYDFIFQHEHPGRVRGGNGIRWLPCLTFDVKVGGGQPVVGQNVVEFTARGPWKIFEPDARVEIVLRIDDGGKISHRILKTRIRPNQGREKVVIPDDVKGKKLHLQVRKIGPEKFIGGASPEFSL